MKATTIEVPRTGASVQLVMRGGGPSAQVVIVAADDVEVRLRNPVSEPAADAPPARTSPSPGEKPVWDLREIHAGLVKQRVKRRATAVNVIRTMFQFTRPITAEAANKILEELRKSGYLSISASGAVEVSGMSAA